MSALHTLESPQGLRIGPQTPTPVANGLLAVSLAAMEVNRPVPVDIWNAKGMLLLRKGEALATLERQQVLSRHQPAIRESDRRDWLLAGQVLADQMPRVATSQPPGLSEATPHSLGEHWLDLHARLAVLLHQHVGVRDFLLRFEALRQQAMALMDRHPDESLFVLVQMLYDTQVGYCASNALAAAAVCHVIGPTAGLSVDQESSLFNAGVSSFSVQ